MKTKRITINRAIEMIALYELAGDDSIRASWVANLPAQEQLVVACYAEAKGHMWRDTANRIMDKNAK